MPDVTIDPIYLVILLVFGAGVCLGWIAHALTTPAAKPLPHVIVPLKTQVAPPRVVPAAPPKPLWEEDLFFARPETLGDRREDDIEHASGNVVSMTQRPLAGRGAMG